MCSPNMYSIFCFYQGSMSTLLYSFKLLKRRRIVAPSLKLHIYYCLIFSNLVKMKIFIFLDLHNNINFHMQVAEHRIWLVRWIELPPTSRVVWRFQFHWNAPPPLSPALAIHGQGLPPCLLSNDQVQLTQVSWPKSWSVDESLSLKGNCACLRTPRRFKTNF